MTSEELCIALLRAESETEVSDVLEGVGTSDGDVSWHVLDGRDTNFNVVTNQASTGAKALTELCTNMVDAILLRHAYEAGIDPTSDAAPQSVTEAVRELVRLQGAPSGILAEVDSLAYLREYAESNLVIGVTGARDPCFTFVDTGEGQLPDNFEDTFLSLSSGSKSRIPFVQGKYNMGSAGVLSFCGRRWYKLVVSRRFDGSSPWGWSLIRRRPEDGPPVAEYLKLDGQIPRFERPDLHPLVRRDGRPDDKVQRSTGTIVKLYSYFLGRAANFRTIREALNENLISTVLPFRLMDYRARPDRKRGGRRAQGVDERTVSGMDFQLRRLDDEEEDVGGDELAGDPLHIAEIRDPELGTIHVEAIPLPRTSPGWLQARRNRMRVYHAVNGQVQYKRGRDYLAGSCRLPGLKDRVVILVDASDLTESAHNDVWKGDRETIRQTEIGKHYEMQITEAIRGSTSLKRLEDRIRNEETEQLAEEAQVELFRSVISSDPHIAQLLPGGAVVRLPGKRQTGGGAAAYQGRYSPTFVELVGGRLRNSGVDLEVNERRRIRFKTDPTNDWLTRPDNRGSVRFLKRGRMDVGFGFNAELADGILTITIRATEDQVSIGETIKTEISLADDSMPLAVSDPVTFHVVASRRKPGGGGGGRAPRGDDDEDDSDERGLPTNRWITQDGRMVGSEETTPWGELDDNFTDQDGGYVRDLSEDEKLYYINYDNAHFQHFLLGERTDIEKRVLTEQYRLSMLILMMGFEDACSRLSNSQDQIALAEWVDQARRLAAQGAATVVMSIAKTLPKLVNADTVGDADDD